jgi:hypothetical protein
MRIRLVSSNTNETGPKNSKISQVIKIINDGFDEETNKGFIFLQSSELAGVG